MPGIHLSLISSSLTVACQFLPQIFFSVYLEPSVKMGDNDAAKNSIAACTRFSTLTSMAASKYPSAIRPSRQLHLRPAAACTIQTSASVDQVKRNALAIGELTAGQAELEQSFLSFQRQVEEESSEFRSYMESRFNHLEALILSQHQQGPGESCEFERY